MKKTNIPVTLGVATHSDLIELADSMTGGYRVSGTDEVFASFPEAYTEDQPGSYVTKFVFTMPGIYDIIHESTDARIGHHFSTLVVSDANIDDVKAAIDAAQLDITSIKTQVDLLDEETMNGLNAKIDIANSSLDNLTVLIDDDGNDAIVSLRELLADISANGSSLDALNNSYNNVQALLTGAEYLADGTTANPLVDRGLSNIYDRVSDIFSGLQVQITSAHEDSLAAMELKKTDIEDLIAGVSLICESNASVLTDSDHGNAALLTAINGLSSNSGEGTDQIKALLESASDGLVAIHDTIKIKIEEVKTVVDANGVKLDTLVSRSNISVI